MDPNRYIEPQAPPSTYAIAAVLEGDGSAWWRVAGLTGVRAAVMYPALRLLGRPPGASLAEALAGSTAITIYMLGYYSFARAEQMRRGGSA